MYLVSSVYLLRQLPCEFTEGTQPKPVTCSAVSAIWKCMPEICGILSPKNRRHKPIHFRRFSFSTSQLDGNSNGLFLWKVTRYNNGERRWKIQWVPYSVSKFHELWSTNTEKLMLCGAFCHLSPSRTQQDGNILRSEPDLQTHVKLEGFPAQNWGATTT